MSLTKATGVAIKSNRGLTVARMPNETAESVLAWREIMSRPNLAGTQSGYFYRPTAGARLPFCARQPKTSPLKPPRPGCPRPNRSAAPQNGIGAGVLLKKVVCPCVAAFLFGKTLSYLVEFSAFFLFLLR
jgi:hypothetical protein